MPSDRSLHHVDLADVSVCYSTAGSGPHVVLVHGLGQDQSMWDDVRRELPDFTTIAYDIRGHGGSSLGEANGTLAQLADDLIAVLEETGPATVIGFSLGGSIALWAASARPDLMRTVIAVATSSVVGSAAASALADRAAIFGSGDEDAIRASLLGDTLSQLAGADIDPEPIVESRVAAVGDGRGYVNGAHAVISMRTDSLNERLGLITTPTLIVSGENDAWCPRRAADIMLEQLPTASFIELPGVGHLVTDAAPQALVSAVRRWLGEELS